MKLIGALLAFKAEAVLRGPSWSLTWRAPIAFILGLFALGCFAIDDALRWVRRRRRRRP